MQGGRERREISAREKRGESRIAGATESGALLTGERERDIGIADASVGYVRLAGRAVGQQLPKWSGKQYPCAELRAER